MKSVSHKSNYYIINGITIYRIVAAPFLLILLFTEHHQMFKWLLAVSFFTDLIDGYLARKYQVASILGTRLDSLGDDLTVLVATIALFVTKPEFIRQQAVLFILLGGLFVVQTGYALIRYGKVTSFHTYLAKTAALLQGVFLILVFFTDKPILPLFYIAAGITILELIEEIILVHWLPEWKANVKGVFFVKMEKRK